MAGLGKKKQRYHLLPALEAPLSTFKLPLVLSKCVQVPQPLPQPYGRVWSPWSPKPKVGYGPYLKLTLPLSILASLTHPQGQRPPRLQVHRLPFGFGSWLPLLATLPCSLLELRSFQFQM